MFDLLAIGVPEAWPALVLPLWGLGLFAVAVMLTVLLLAVPREAPTKPRPARVRRLHGSRAA